jgi:hypothetical protein
MEIGDAEAARHLFEGLVNTFSASDKLFLAEAYERLGQLHEAAGRTREAIFYHQKLVQAWANADDPLRARRDAAQARLEALRAAE